MIKFAPIEINDVETGRDAITAHIADVAYLKASDYTLEYEAPMLRVKAADVGDGVVVQLPMKEGMPFCDAISLLVASLKEARKSVITANWPTYRAGDRHEIEIDFISEHKMSGGKSNPLNGRVFKVSRGAKVAMYTATDGYIREAKHLGITLEDEINSDGRRWGYKPFPNCSLVHHMKDGALNTYAEFFAVAPPVVTYYVDGMVATEEQLADIKERSAPSRDMEGIVPIMMLNLDNIVRAEL